MVAVKDNWAEFKFFRPNARMVFLVGDFNGWGENELPMACGTDGYWHARLRLPAGAFRFRYYADGQWFTDYAAFGLEQGPVGLDSVVVVKPAPAFR